MRAETAAGSAETAARTVEEQRRGARVLDVIHRTSLHKIRCDLRVVPVISRIRALVNLRDIRSADLRDQIRERAATDDGLEMDTMRRLGLRQRESGGVSAVAPANVRGIVQRRFPGFRQRNE